MIPEKNLHEHKPGAETLEEAKGTLELIQDGISKTSRELWLAGLGVFSTIDKEGTKLFNRFVDKGRVLVENGKTAAVKKNGEPEPTFVSEKVDQLTHDVLLRFDGAAEYVRKKIFGSAEHEGEVSRDEMKILSEKVDKLTESVASLIQKMEESTKAGIRRTTA
jgi:poly(hydroxyalkanoate) granule-associated protein